jgi:hypothetical protein
MSNDNMNIEVTKQDMLDVVVVTDTQKTLSMDMMHRVAQWGMPSWLQMDETSFDATQLRADLTAGRAVYLGTASYQGKDVYRIRLANNDILLLDRQYLPVNVLDKGTGQMLYQVMRWVTPSQVPESMWDMTVPGNFHLGQLPSLM